MRRARARRVAGQAGAVMARPHLILIAGDLAAVPTLGAGGLGHASAPAHRCGASCNVTYHARRAMEESERASLASNESVRSAHEGLAHLHLSAAANLRRRLQLVVDRQIN